MYLPKRIFLNLLALACVFGSSHSVRADDFSIWSIPDTDFGSWSSGGTLTNTVTGCIESWKGNKTKDYKLTLTGDSSGSDFYLYRNGDITQTGNNRIQVDIFVRDIFTQPSFEQLSNDDETSERKGQKNNCPSGDNGQLQFTILASELAAANGGNFSATFELSGRGGHRSRKNDSTEFEISVTVANSQLKISGLQNIALTTDPSSTGGLTADEAFCVYSDATSYKITISSDEYQAGNFALTSGLGDKVQIDLLYADNGSGTSMQTVQPSSALTGSGDNSSNSCSGNDNATLRVNIDESTLRQASSGNYAATLTLLVEPI